MSVFLTDPDNPQVQEQLKGDYDYKIALENEWTRMGIPYEHARTATIDLKPMWIPCLKNKLTAIQAAHLLYQEVVKTYKIKRD